MHVHVQSERPKRAACVAVLRPMVNMKARYIYVQYDGLNLNQYINWLGQAYIVPMCLRRSRDLTIVYML